MTEISCLTQNVFLHAVRTKAKYSQIIRNTWDVFVYVMHLYFYHIERQSLCLQCLYVESTIYLRQQPPAL